jgi:hypothetical protein
VSVLNISDFVMKAASKYSANVWRRIRTKNEENKVRGTCKGEVKGYHVEAGLYALVCLLCCCIYCMFTRMRIMARQHRERC